MKNNTKQQNNFFDALFYANATSTEKLEFHLAPNEFKVLLKLIHYSNDQKNITWKSSEISKHTSIPIGAIDKAIQRIKQKGYITTTTYNIDTYTKHRTIFINWNKIDEVNDLYQKSLQLSEINSDIITENKAPESTISTKVISEDIKEIIVAKTEDKQPIKLNDIPRQPVEVKVLDIVVPVIENKIDSINFDKFNVDDLRNYDEKYSYQNNGVTANNYFEILTKLNKGKINFQQMLIECDEMIIQQQKIKADRIAADIV